MLGQRLALGVPRRRSSILIVKAIVIPPYDSPASGGVLDIITSSLLFSRVSSSAIYLLLGHGMPNNTCMPRAREVHSLLSSVAVAEGYLMPRTYSHY